MPTPGGEVDMINPNILANKEWKNGKKK